MSQTTPLSESIVQLSRPKQPRKFFSGKLNLEQQKKRAKELLKQMRRGDAEAIKRFAVHPRADSFLSNRVAIHSGHSDSAAERQGLSADGIQLSHCQLVLARENGFDSWPAMKAHIESLSLSGETPDTQNTLHIRCGSDIKHSLEVAGFCGQFLEFSDPFCQGPIADLPPDELIVLRSQFIAQAYQLELNDALARGRQAYDGLAACLSPDSKWQKIVLWFEHDSYDQLILAYLLSRFYRYQQAFPEFTLPLEMICVDQVPGVEDFIGLGQLTPELLRHLWQHNKAPVTTEQLVLGEKVWLALCEADSHSGSGEKGTTESATDLQRLAFSSKPLAISMMAKALQRHLQEQPDQETGLRLTELLTLELLTEYEDLTAGCLFGRYMSEKEPLPWLGDLMYWYILRQMAERTEPLIVIDRQEFGDEWPKYPVQITPAGLLCLERSKA